jgi:endonuclease/exonuclease/phosphatase family metal-dependent hydrolase
VSTAIEGTEATQVPATPPRPGPRPLSALARHWRWVLVWLAVTAVALWTLLWLTGIANVYPVIQLLAFTTYVAPVAVLVAVLAGVLRRWLAFGLALAMVLGLGAVMGPRAFGGPDPDGGGPRLRILSANMDHGRSDPATMVRLVREQDVDVLALQEFTLDAQQALSAAGLDTLLPYGARYPSDDPGGSAIYSRLPLTDVGYRSLPATFGQAYGVLELPSGQRVRVESAHPPSPASEVTAADWRAGQQAQPRASAYPGPQILVGDFNATLDHAPMRALLGSGYTDAASELGDGFTPTWPYDGSRLPKVTIDHVLVAGLRVYSFTTFADPGSDHRAVFATLGLPG